MNSLFGMKVLTSPLVQPVPVLQLSYEFNACTDSFKIKMNKWLLDTFGTKEVMYVMGGNTLLLNRETLHKIERAFPKNYVYPTIHY